MLTSDSKKNIKTIKDLKKLANDNNEYAKIALEKSLISEAKEDAKSILEKTRRADSQSISDIAALYGIKPDQIKSNITIFLDCSIEDPTFNSQVKDKLTTNKSAFGSKFDIPDDFKARLKKALGWKRWSNKKFEKYIIQSLTDYAKGIENGTIDE